MKQNATIQSAKGGVPIVKRKSSNTFVTEEYSL